MWNQIIERLDVSELVTQVVSFLPNLIVGIIIFIAFLIFYRISSKGLRAALNRAAVHEKLIQLLIGSMYKYVVVMLGLVMALDQMGVNVGAALAGLGVAGIAVGFAAQDSIANSIAGFMIFWDKPFVVGDWITAEDEYGRVTDITLRTTRIRTVRNTYVVIPNKTIIDSVLENHSKHGETRVDVPVGIAYKEDIPRAREVLLAALDGVQGIGKLASDVIVSNLGGSSVDLLVRVWIEDAGDEKPTYANVLERSKLALDAAGIEIPFPHLQLFVDDVRPTVWDQMTQHGLTRIQAEG